MILSSARFSVKNRFLIFILFFVFQLIITSEWNTWTGIRDNISLWGYNYMFVIKNTSPIKKELHQKSSVVSIVPERSRNERQENMENSFLKDLIGM